MRQNLKMVPTVLVLTILGSPMVSCMGDRPDGNDEEVGYAESAVWRDGDDWIDDMGEHPQVIRLTKDRTKLGRCTGWLSSSNTITTNAHCIGGATDVGWLRDPSSVNGTEEQMDALDALGPSIGASIHPYGGECVGNPTEDCCRGGDLAVIVFDPANAVPRSVMKPLAVMKRSSAGRIDA